MMKHVYVTQPQSNIDLSRGVNIFKQSEKSHFASYSYNKSLC